MISDSIGKKRYRLSKGSLFKYGIGLTWLMIAIISINHLTTKWPGLSFNLPGLGALFLFAICVTVTFLGKDHWKPTLLVFCTFLLIGFICGPFLEPLGDPLDHLVNIKDGLTKESLQISKVNRGLWHYAMSGFLLKPFQAWLGPLRGLDLLHGLYCGLLTVCIFLVGICAKLPRKWAFFGCVVAFVFFGFREFSYFSYYSFGPSFSSLMLFWLWIAACFFHHGLGSYTLSLLAALLLTPILITNHIQEAIFLWFAFGIFTLFSLTGLISKLNLQ